MHETLCFSIQSPSPNLDDLRVISDAVARSSIVLVFFLARRFRAV